MYKQKRHGEAAQRFAERRRREDEAPRLAAEVPKLTELKLEICERSGGNLVAEPTHIRRVVVESAPALFFVPCGDPRCKDGGHEVTHIVMNALRSGDARFEGEDVCSGSQGSGHCARVMHFIGHATYSS